MKLQKKAIMGIFTVLAAFCLVFGGCNNGNGATTEQTVKPTATPPGETYATAQAVTLESATAGADIHYTLNGSTPTSASTKYTSTININTTSTLKAIAVKTGMTNSEILTEEYIITQVAQPTATPAGGTYQTTQTVTLKTATPEADIHYTTDGNTPTASSTKYTSPITISETTTLKAIAIKTDMTNSDILTETYFIGFTVTFDADGGSPAPVSPVVIKQGNTITQPSAMSKNWHTFGGWYTDSARTVSALFPITVTGDVSLHARWIVNTLTNIADVTGYLNSLPNNTKDNPATLTLNFDLGIMTQAGSGWQQLLAALGTSGKYVDLNLSACTMNGTSFNPDFSVATGKDRIVSIILPVVATSIAAGSTSNATFKSFDNLKSINGAYVTTIGNDIFFPGYGNRNTTLQTADFPRATSIGTGSFYGCESLQTVDFPQVTSIGTMAFTYCESLQNVSFPLVTVIESATFENCTSLESVNFPKVTAIYPSAFEKCTSLQSLSFPLATTIYAAFIDCTSLQSVSLPASANINEYDSNPFGGCTSLTSFTLSGTGSLSVIENGKALVRSGTILIAYPSASGTVTLNTVTSIHTRAFDGCESLQNLSLPQVTSTKNGAFSDCKGLQNLFIPKIASIGDSAFFLTGNATLSITMGSTAPTLGIDMFLGIFASSAKTVIIKIPAGATGYTPAPSPFAGSAVAINSGTDTNWANGFRGGGWDGTTWASGGATSKINQNVSLIIQQQ